MQLVKYINEYLVHIKQWKNLSVKTIRAYQYDLHQFERILKNDKVKKVNSTAIKLYIQQLHAWKLHPNSVKRKMISLKSFLNYLLQHNKIRKIDDSLFSQTYNLPKKLPRTLTIQDVTIFLKIYETKYNEAKTFYQKIIRSRDLALMDMLISTGIRISEASNIDLENIDWQDNKIVIHGKNNKERIVFISSTGTLNNLKSWIQYREKLEPQTKALFVNKYGDRISIYGITNIFHKYDQLLNLSTKATPHFFRHTFATELLNNGANLRDVQEILGHANITTTQIYTQVTTTRKQEVFFKYNYRNELETSE